MARHLPAYLKPRRQPDGSYRPRWEPGPSLRARGFSGEDLKDEAGQWLGLEAAIARAETLNAEVAGQPRPRKKLIAEARSCQALVETYYRSADFRHLAPQTQYDYRLKLGIWLETFGDTLVRAVRKPHMVAFWQRLHDARGHHQAAGVTRVVGAVMTYAELIGWRDEDTNPAHKLKRPTPPGRLMLWTPEEVEATIAAADRMGLASIGDAVLLALHSSQRQADVLAMPETLIDAGALRLSQMKTKARVDAPMTPQLLTRLEAARRRKRKAGIWQAREIVVSEATGRAYRADHFRHTFADVRAVAAQACPSVASKHFQDLRDTAVTRLALAGCDLIRIIAITGHSAASVQMIMKHYLTLNSAMAADAIGKLVAWMEKEGVRA